MTVDDRRLSDTAVDILSHLMPDQGVEHQQIFSRDSLGILPTPHGEIHAHLYLCSPPSLTHPPTHSLTHSLTHSPTHSFTHHIDLLACSYIHPITYQRTCLLIHPILCLFAIHLHVFAGLNQVLVGFVRLQ